MSSAYDGVIGGKLKLKGKALDVKSGSIKKKKKHKRQQQQNDQTSEIIETDQLEGGSSSDLVAVDANEEETGDKWNGEEKPANIDDLLTPAEKRYIEQRNQLDVKRLAKTAVKSHRDRIQDFNQYLANMSEHYDIPKVGPG